MSILIFYFCLFFHSYLIRFFPYIYHFSYFLSLSPSLSFSLFLSLFVSLSLSFFQNELIRLLQISIYFFFSFFHPSFFHFFILLSILYFVYLFHFFFLLSGCSSRWEKSKSQGINIPLVWFRIKNSRRYGKRGEDVIFMTLFNIIYTFLFFILLLL